MTHYGRACCAPTCPTTFLKTFIAAFGLEGSSYEKFLWPAKKLSKLLERLGATAICLRAEGDVQHTLGYYVDSQTAQ